MIGARDIETGSLVLSVNLDDLMSVIHALRRGSRVEFALSPPAPRPVFRPVTHLAISPGCDGPLRVAVDDDVAEVSGGAVALGLLADELVEFIQENDLNEPGMHAHFDPREKQFNGLEISANSVDLIVTGPVPDG